MKKISEIINIKQFGKYENKSNLASIDEEKTKKVINRLFVRFENIFPKFWVNIKSQEHLNGIKDEWFECFQRAGIQDMKLLQIGLEMAQLGFEEYLPKASRFIDWCINGEISKLGFPEAPTAFNIAGLMNVQFSDYI